MADETKRRITKKMNALCELIKCDFHQWKIIWWENGKFIGTSRYLTEEMALEAIQLCKTAESDIPSSFTTETYKNRNGTGFVAQLKRRVSYPYPRRTYAIATVSGVPSWVNRLSKAART